MYTEKLVFFITSLLALIAITSCEAVVEEHKVNSCDPNPPATCADLGEEEEQIIGCCNPEASTVYFCNSGKIDSVSCDDKTCDFDPDKEKMVCVD